MITTGTQIRAARALLGWRQRDLAKAAGLHQNAIAYWERHQIIPPPLPSGRQNSEPVACRRIREVLFEHGVAVFCDPLPGVKLVDQKQFLGVP
jgi:predicted transcriptional regulator